MPCLTEQQCKSIIFNLGIKYGISPARISLKLLSKEDKTDMLNGDIPLDCLDLAVKLWIEAGCPDYANGCSKPTRRFTGHPSNVSS